MIEFLPNYESTPGIDPPSEPFEFDPHMQLPYSDGKPVESPWHAKQAPLLSDVVGYAWKGRRFYAGGNNFFYYSPEQIKKNDFLGPDFYVVLDVDPDRERLYWCNWQEGGRNPDLVIEFLSPSTEANDRGKKKSIYEKLGISEYYLVDPDTKAIEGWKLGSSGYVAMEARKGRFWSEKLQMEFGTWTGRYSGLECKWVRGFDRNGALIPTHEEAAVALADEARAQAARAIANADQATVQANQAKALYEKERDLRLAEKKRLDDAEAKMAALLEEINRLKSRPANPPSADSISG